MSGTQRSFFVIKVNSKGSFCRKQLEMPDIRWQWAASCPFYGDELPVLNSPLYFLHPTHHLHILHVSFRFSPVELPFPLPPWGTTSGTHVISMWVEGEWVIINSGVSHINVESFFIGTGGKYERRVFLVKTVKNIMFNITGIKGLCDAEWMCSGRNVTKGVLVWKARDDIDCYLMR